MERCRCGRDQRVGEAWCPACGQRFGLGAAGLGSAAVPPPRRTGTIVAAQVVLGLGAAGNALLALISAIALITLSSVVAYTGAGAAAAGLVILLYCLAALGFDVWALLAIGKGNRTARLLATVVPAVAIPLDVLVFAVLGSGFGQGVVTVVLAVPHAAALAILLWVPEGSRHHFGDAVRAAPRPVSSGPIPALRPVPSGPIPALRPVPSGPIPALRPTPASGLSFTPNPAPRSPARSVPTPASGLTFTQNPVPAPRTALAPDATTVTLPVSARPVDPTSVPARSARSMMPTLVPSSAGSAAPATPPGGRHRVAP